MRHTSAPSSSKFLLSDSSFGLRNLALTKDTVKTFFFTLFCNGNEQADQAAKEGAAGGSHMNETKTTIPWQVAKNKIEEYTITKWKQKWISATDYKHTKLFYN